MLALAMFSLAWSGSLHAISPIPFSSADTAAAISSSHCNIRATTSSSPRSRPIIACQVQARGKKIHIGDQLRSDLGNALLPTVVTDIEKHIVAIEKCAHEEECLLDEAESISREMKGISTNAAGKGGIGMQARLSATKKIHELHELAKERRDEIERHMADLESLKHQRFHELSGEPFSA